MRHFELFVTCENAAFDRDRWRIEVARLLRGAAELVEEHGETFAVLFDQNGNKVGTFQFEEG